MLEILFVTVILTNPLSVRMYYANIRNGKDVGKFGQRHKKL